METKKRNILRGIGIFLIGAIFCAGFSVIAYNGGNQIGYSTGHNTGYSTGHYTGYSAGHDAGYTIGREDGIPKVFTSVTELKEWLAQDKTDNQRWIEETHDCDDFAMDLVDAANKDGYTMYILTGNILTYVGDLDNYGFYYTYEIYGEKWIKWSEIQGHAYNFVVIDGSTWIIEPQTDQIYCIGVEL